MKKKVPRFLSCVSAFAVLTLAGWVSAGTITYTGQVDTTGQGFGTVQNLLTLQNNTSEAGSVSWNGSAVTTGGSHVSGPVATNGKTWPWLLSEITSDPGQLGLFLNLSETGGDPSISLNSLVMTFIRNGSPYDIIATATFTPTPTVFSADNLGVGGAGFVLNVNLTASEIADINTVGLSNVRIGLDASIGDTWDGPETFSVAQVQPIPLPGAVWMGMGLIASMGGAKLLRRRQDTVL